MRLPILLFALLPLAASAQRLSFGIQGGVPVQTPLGRTDQTPFAIGPSVNINILGGLSLESGLLYDRLGRRYDNFAFFNSDTFVTLGAATSRGSAIEVPLLAKYRFRSVHNGWRPFLTAGPTVRRTSITYNQSSSILGGTQFVTLGSLPSAFAEKTTQWNVDPTVGAGADFRAGRFHLEPEMRYSYWAAGKSGPIRKNQVDFLLGFRF